MKPGVYITDHAVLRYLERAHGLDVDAVCRHLAGRLTTGARLGAVGVTIDNVKFVLKRDAETVSAVTVLLPQWPART